jgi:cobyrinic acid a,c-diamide synthase
MSQVLISAAHKSSGKTTLTLGLAAVMRRRGLAVQPFKKGPDYIDPMWLGQAAGRPCHTLDFYTADAREVLQTVAWRAGGADIALIEGNKGLYDGLDVRGSNSNAALAKLLGSPVVLVLDTQGVIRGVAPLLIGYQAFDPQVRIAGVILNRVAGARHEGKLRAVIEHYTDIPILGAVHRDPRLQLTERHLGLMPSNEDERARHRIGQIADAVAEQVDLDAVLAIARQAPLPHVPLPAPQPQGHGAAVRIAVARDAAFGFYYPGDLEALERCGAKLVDLDTQRDRDLPHVDGLFIGGGFPETQMERLEANAGLRRAIRSAILGGLPTYAECGGLMYLSRSLRWGERRCEMVGVIEADAVMHDTPQGRGYVRLEETGVSPWAAYARPGEALEIAAHEFHYSALEGLAPDTRYAYRMRRGSGIDGRHDGIVQHNLLACYTHLRDTGRYHWTRRFVAFVRHCAKAPRPGDSDPSPQRDSDP